MPYSFHPVSNGFLIHNTACSKAHLYTKPLSDHVLQDLYLYLAHHLGMNLLKFLIPDNLKRGIFLLKLHQLWQKSSRITPFRQINTIA